MKIRLAIRGYAEGALLFEDHVAIEESKFDLVIARVGAKHAIALAEYELHMIEIEFLDEPNPRERFFRFGSDPSGMVQPIRIDLEKLN